LYRVGCIREAWARLGDSFASRDGFECTAQIVLQLNQLGARLAEVPFSLDYAAKRGSSNMRPLRTILPTLGLMCSFRFKRKPDH